MSDINDLIHRNSKMAYEQGRKDEQNRLLRIIKEISTPEDEIGEFLYLKDLLDYMENDYDKNN